MDLQVKCYIFMSAVICTCYCNAAQSESDLHKRLFNGYNLAIMPRSNDSEKLLVTLDMQLLSIEAIDEKKQLCTIRAFLEVRWRNEKLAWNPELYGGLERINVPNEKIWLPDLALLDTYDGLTELGQKGGHAVVDYTGDLIIWPYKMYTVGCKIKVRQFPFDTQTCVFDFLSWTNPTSSIDLRTSVHELNRNRYTENGEWWLEAILTEYYLQHYGNDSWAHVKYTFTVKRKWLFYALNIITPIVCISMLNIVCFMLPASSGEKITLCISTFLSLAVFLTMITSTLPESSDEISTIGWYVGLQLVGSGLTILVTVISILFYTRDSTDYMPPFVRFLCRLCCQKHRQKFKKGSSVSTTKYTGERKMSTVSNGVMVSVYESDVTWVSASYAFDRLCMVVALGWHICLFIGLVVGLNSN